MSASSFARAYVGETIAETKGLSGMDFHSCGAMEACGVRYSRVFLGNSPLFFVSLSASATVFSTLDVGSILSFL